MKLINNRLVLPVLAAAASMGIFTLCSASSSKSPASPKKTAAKKGGVKKAVDPARSAAAKKGAATRAANKADADASAAAEIADVVKNPPAKSMQDALNAARAEFSGDASKMELEPRKDNGLKYKIVLISTDTKYSAQFDADSLERISEKRSDLGKDAVKKLKKTFDPNSLIELKQAAETARNQQAGSIIKWKIEGKKTGLVQYEFDIKPVGAVEDTEVQINAKDGLVIND